MGKLIAHINNKLVIRNFRYLVFQFSDGRYYGPIEFEGTVTLNAGEGLPKDGKTLEFIVSVDPKTQMKKNSPIIAKVDSIIWMVVGASLLLFFAAVRGAIEHWF